jgi:hypothetical protein
MRRRRRRSGVSFGETDAKRDSKSQRPWRATRKRWSGCITRRQPVMANACAARSGDVFGACCLRGSGDIEGGVRGGWKARRPSMP